MTDPISEWIQMREDQAVAPLTFLNWTGRFGPSVATYANGVPDDTDVVPKPAARQGAAIPWTAWNPRRVHRHDVAVILGSGWTAAARVLGEPAAEWTRESHDGEAHTRSVSSVPFGSRNVLLFRGRRHLYESHMVEVVQDVHDAFRAGCTEIVLTNAAGTIHEDLSPGDVVVISDHINLTGTSPVTSVAWPQTPFVDLTDAYSPRLREKITSLKPPQAGRTGRVPEGVYACLPGPHYETPAEIRMLRTMGADLVGMSTVHECIAARQLGMEVLGLSLVTNMAAGMGPNLDHREVLDVGRRSTERLGAILKAALS